MENAYATIKLQVLPILLTPAYTRKKVPHSIFATRLLFENSELFEFSSIYVGVWQISAVKHPPGHITTTPFMHPCISKSK
jgi:hypothetical protein